MFVTAFSVERNGWCAFRALGNLFMNYHAGPLPEQAVAESEARRLNDLTANAEEVNKAQQH